MKSTLTYGIWMGVLLLLNACSDVFVGRQPKDNPREVFEHLWGEINRKYSFIDYKRLNLDSLYTVYSTQIQPGMDEVALFRVLESLVNELRDGHANLSAPFSFSNYYPLWLNSPENFDGRLLLERYLLRDPSRHFITGPFSHTILDTVGVRVGLVTYRSFMNGYGAADLDFVLDRFQGLNGVIIDMRSNGGGAINNVYPLAGRFADVERISHYNRMKSGPGRNEFGPDQTVYVRPDGEKRFTGRVVLLTNRGTYSAASLFALQMRALPHARLVGDTTGGGLGIPNGGSLPNGWTYRFSVGQVLSPELDANGQRFNWEDGIPPHIKVDLDPVLAAQGYDSMVERAIQYIATGN